jgi:hypothetical protein
VNVSIDLDIMGIELSRPTFDSQFWRENPPTSLSRTSFSVFSLMEFKEVLDIPDDFDFPFQPYPIQKDFMTNLYTVLEGGKLGIFESPTGTVSTSNVVIIFILTSTLKHSLKC